MTIYLAREISQTNVLFRVFHAVLSFSYYVHSVFSRVFDSASPLVVRNAINNSRHKRTAVIAVAAQGCQKDADDTRCTRSYETKKRRLVSETQHFQDDVKLRIAKLGRSKAVVNVGSLENEKVRAREMFSVGLY